MNSTAPRGRRWAMQLAPAPLLFAIACGAAGEAPPTEVGQSTYEDHLALGERYMNDPDFRRAELEASLANPDNGYSRLRLEHYTEDQWGALAQWNPLSAPIDVGTNVGPPDGRGESFARLDIDGTPWEAAALVELGRRAFFEYPVQLAPHLKVATGSAAGVARYGLWTDGATVGGARWSELPSGGTESTVTCAMCHAAVENGSVVPGMNNPDLDVAGMLAAHSGGAPGMWVPGRVDVTNDGIENATTIGDLRPVRWQVALHRAATIRNGLVPLAIRIETLVITSLDQAARPPRKLAFAIALYLWQLEPEPMRKPDASSRRGATLFADRCASCHEPPGFSGPSVPIELIGTDPAVGMSPDRATGLYRVPSLHAVGDRRRLLANGAVLDVRELLSADRTANGHSFGIDLRQEEKSDLVAYLETL